MINGGSDTRKQYYFHSDVNKNWTQKDTDQDEDKDCAMPTGAMTTIWPPVAESRIFIWWGYNPGGQGDRSPPMGCRGGAPVGNLETEALCRHCLQIFTAQTIRIRKFRTIHFMILGHAVEVSRSRFAKVEHKLATRQTHTRRHMICKSIIRSQNGCGALSHCTGKTQWHSVASPSVGHWGTCPLEFANARKFCRPNARRLSLMDDFVTTNFGTRAPRARAPWSKIAKFWRRHCTYLAYLSCFVCCWRWCSVHPSHHRVPAAADDLVDDADQLDDGYFWCGSHLTLDYRWTQSPRHWTRHRLRHRHHSHHHYHHHYHRSRCVFLPRRSPLSTNPSCRATECEFLWQRQQQRLIVVEIISGKFLCAEI